MRIVLADDHALFRDGVASLLAAWGHEVVGSAGDGEARQNSPARDFPPSSDRRLLHRDDAAHDLGPGTSPQAYRTAVGGGVDLRMAPGALNRVLHTTIILESQSAG